MPRVTVMICSHRKKLLPEAIQSVLKQTFQDFELLVNYCEENNPNKINGPMAVARGEFGVILCDDDKLAPHFLEDTVRAADRTGAGVVYTDRRCFGPGVRQPSIIRSREWSMASFSGDFSCPVPMTCLFRMDLWRALGGYRDMPYADWDWLVRACKAGATGHHVEKPLFLYRNHPEQLSATLDHAACMVAFFSEHRDLAAILKKRIAMPFPVDAEPRWKLSFTTQTGPAENAEAPYIP